MARPTRQARRERRAQQREDRAATERGRAATQQVMPAAEPAERPDVQTSRRRGGLIGFIGECWGELKKVEWPNQRQVMTGTVVVIIACAIVGGYLWGVDTVLEPFVERVLLGQ